MFSVDGESTFNQQNTSKAISDFNQAIGNEHNNLQRPITPSITFNKSEIVEPTISINTNSVELDVKEMKPKLNLCLSPDLLSATCDTKILYRFPSNVENPPNEVTEFCLPLGAQIQKISHTKFSNDIINEILFGTGQTKRNGKCFIFTIQDKTIPIVNQPHGDIDNQITEENDGRLYGICVIHSRLLHDPVAKFDLESMVTYAFITRFPFFDFFFQLIYDIITLERLNRMELLTHMTNNFDGQLDTDPSNDNNNLNEKLLYSYLPDELLNNVMKRLSEITVPKINEKLVFRVGLGMLPIEKVRTFQNGSSNLNSYSASEYLWNSMEWSLPILFNYLSVDLLIWALSLLLMESKVIIIGTEPGIIRYI